MPNVIQKLKGRIIIYSIYELFTFPLLFLHFLCSKFMIFCSPFRAELMAEYSLTFLSLKKVTVSPLFMKFVFTGHKFLD